MHVNARGLPKPCWSSVPFGEHRSSSKLLRSTKTELILNYCMLSFPALTNLLVSRPLIVSSDQRCLANQSQYRPIRPHFIQLRLFTFLTFGPFALSQRSGPSLPLRATDRATTFSSFIIRHHANSIVVRVAPVATGGTRSTHPPPISIHDGPSYEVQDWVGGAMIHQTQLEISDAHVGNLTLQIPAAPLVRDVSSSSISPYAAS